MARIQVTNKVREYPDDDKNQKVDLIIKNHWNYDDRVVLVFEGKEYVYIASHLEKAIRNAINAH